MPPVLKLFLPTVRNIYTYSNSYNVEQFEAYKGTSSHPYPTQ